MVEARGVEPLSKEAEIQFSTSVAFDERIPPEGLAQRQAYPRSSFMLHRRRKA